MEDKYLKIDNIDPKYWGRSGWIFLNSIALTYKPEHRNKYKLLIKQLPDILPCRSCGENLRKKINELDDALESKEKLLIYLRDIRNEIYKEQNRRQKIKSLEENINEIFEEKSGIYNNIIMGISIIIIVILLYNR